VCDVPDLQDIVDDLEAEIRRPISVEDRRWRLLAHSAQPDETDAVRRQSILSRETAPDVAAWLEGLGLQRARELVDVPANEALGMTRRGCLPIRHGDVLLGFLWVIVGEQPLTDAEREALRRGASEVADNLWNRLREADERRTRTQSLLRALLAGEPTASELAAALRWPLDGAYAVAAVSGDEDLPDRLRRRRGAADFAWIADDGQVIVLARDPEGALPAALAAAGAAGGVSAVFSRLEDVPNARGKAELAALVARARPAFGPVAAWGELGSWGLIASLWVNAGQPLAPWFIIELHSQRRGPQLIEALEAFLDHGGDAAATARALHLHRASLYRRLERVEQLTGLDLEDGDDRLVAHLGLRLFRLRGIRGV
jgi:hypothetical protein